MLPRAGPKAGLTATINVSLEVIVRCKKNSLVATLSKLGKTS